MSKPFDVIVLEHDLGGIELFVNSDENIVSALKLNKTVILDNDNKIIGLNLSNCKIIDLSPLTKFIDLEYLILSDNLITDIKPLKGLIKLKKLDLGSNMINRLEYLESLENLENLRLFNNQIKEIENLDSLKKLENLNLGSNDITIIKSLDNCKKLKTLYFASNNIFEIKGLESLINLQYLYLSFNKIKKLDNLGNLKKLHTLDIVANNIEIIENLDNLTKLNYLHLSHNKITRIQKLNNLIELKNLIIRDNLISEISNLSFAKNLEYLNLDDNKITKIEGLNHTTNLRRLSLERNNIEKIENLYELLNIKSLIELKINNNPIFDIIQLKFESGEDKNHLNEVLSFLKRFRENNKVKVILPAKVLFFGNHSSGKSTFLNYFIDQKVRKFNYKLSSTHILNIHSYKKDSMNNNLPTAILFDFGGQDYYHGVYKAFMTNDSINLVFWKKENDKNQSRIDSENETWLTQDFDRSYWLFQLNYLNDKNSNGVETQPVYLIQTHADKEKRETISGNYEELHVENEFYISLVDEAIKKNSYKASLDYFEQTLIEKIEDKRIEKEEPQWYIDFVNFILSYD